ncbi:DedA family protein [Sporosarcina sp. PTS2304]|uniref:DedA family protein n=1 Tax=Sporosarcina sp. PTS2304 TaxID=2283194 RepID=UPI000E0DA870|nr:DedA family protein [Sporosarcina sp. PTS2304]AXH99405.1 DedA family protein [Sporosarcina sp. PTS2304]
MDQISEYIAQYGYLSVFIFLALGIFGLPMPDEFIVTFAGYLASAGTFHFVFAIIFTISGVMVGTLFTYMLGRKIGKPLIQRFGNYLFLSPHRLQKVERFFMAHGSWAVTIGYFLPGLRHVVCYVSGMSGMSMRRYVLFAIPGVILSTTICVLLGYFIRLPFF